MAKSAPKIVARNFREAHAFARDVLKLSRGSYRVVTSPASLVGVSGEIHLVPDWDKRADRWAMKQKLKYTRLTVIEHPIDAEPAEEQEPSNGDNMIAEGAPLFEVPDTLLDDIREQLRVSEDDEESDDKPAEERESEDKVEKETAPDDDDNGVKEDDSDSDVEDDERPLNGRRRRRCKDCGDLIHPDDVEDHARDHAADSVSLEKKAQERLR